MLTSSIANVVSASDPSAPILISADEPPLASVYVYVKLYQLPEPTVPVAVLSPERA